MAHSGHDQSATDPTRPHFYAHVVRTLATRLARRAAAPAVLALLLVTVIPLGAGAASATSARWAAKCDANVRSRPTTSSTKLETIRAGTVVTIAAKVAGGAYASPCKTSVSGSTWLAITAIGSHTVSSLFGVRSVYAAGALFSPLPGSTVGPIEGIDVSRWQGRIDFGRVRAAGIQFVIAKATEGRYYTDDAYLRNRAGAFGAKLAFTAYHFARPDASRADATLEADHFVAVASIRHGMLVPVLDLESHGTLGSLSLQRWVRTWLGRVYSRTGVRAMIYTNPDFWLRYMGDTRWFADNGYRVLWIANWRVDSPAIPGVNWGGHGWGFWQYTNCGVVPGVTHCLDRDRLNGSTLDAFRI